MPHYCHEHPLGGEPRRIWCGHYCGDRPCRLFMAVWFIRQPRRLLLRRVR